MAPGTRPRNGEGARQENQPKIGRPRKYHTKEEADSARRRLARDLYHRRKSKADNPTARRIRFDTVLRPQDFEGAVPSSPPSTPMKRWNDKKPHDASRNGLDSSAHPSAQPGTNSRNVNPPPPSVRNCQCRVNMMLQVSRLECAIREMAILQLDKMVKATGDVIRSCQQSTRCGCYVGPVDLVCIMSVFEQTASCFDYIAKSGFDGNGKMLVLDLIRQSNTLMDSVDALAQKMMAPSRQKDPGIKAMDRSPVCLNQLNLTYVREAIATFKELFGFITKVHGEI
ncbi:hypothetical protein BO94DRAFT_622425 [Aspergillus sclerotioniger CBS 115572]|uniref:Uncharacterized protein n=1 Tax=Aspergillus sclerotioniger CBS 115572 TaxID=1450535 RepID=A0A317X4M1_9EURO|nr:hypothetical protein BO94DRAFT_622425 [Aspergillus sclerotioniger CBS 115572]PWY93285.1 hypothetical protein BO94DRAFT_622425 [Aspergillus sclerotioniger CBS 115572]